MVDVSVELKKRFVYNNNLPINVFAEPYFADRLFLLERNFSSYTKWKLFMKELQMFNNEQRYLEFYYDTEERIKEYMRQHKSYQKYYSCNLDLLFPTQKHNFNQNIYSKCNIGRKFLSIDLKDANFQSIKRFDSDIVFNKSYYRDFALEFTNIESFVCSKAVRQRIFLIFYDIGKIEEYMINQYIPIISEYFSFDDIKALNKDEVVIDITGINDFYIDDFCNSVELYSRSLGIDIKIEKYVLKEIIKKVKDKVFQTSFYVKDFGFGEFALKKVNKVFYPLVIKGIYNYDICDSDLMFAKNSKLEKLDNNIKFAIKEI